MSADTQKRPAGADQKKVSTWEVIKSVAAAGFGVQSEAARQRDFSHGRPLPYIIAGVIGTIIFIVTVVTVVRLVLHATGA